MQIYFNKGVTLIELLIALSIVVIIAGYSITSFSSYMERQKLKAAGETIFADLRLAQSESIKRNQTVYVDFETYEGGWCYGVNVGSECSCNTKNSCQLDNVEKVKSNERFNGITLESAKFAGNKDYTAFDPVKGFAQADGVKNGTIWLQSDDGTQLAVIVNRLGRVRFCSLTLSGYSNQCPAFPKK